MKSRIFIGIIAIMVLLLAGCASSQCYPPNKIIGNSCCIDNNNNGVCDLDEKENPIEDDLETVEEEPEEVVMETPEEQEEEPQIQEVELPKEDPAPIITGLQLGKQPIKFGETKQWLKINELHAYRSSRDKGMMDHMVYTVMNLGDKKLNAEVELYFDKGRIEDYDARISKDYTIPELEPGEKIVINQSLGIKFSQINKTKEMELTIYEKFVAPRDNLQVLRKEFVPQSLFESMEIFTFGLPE